MGYDLDRFNGAVDSFWLCKLCRNVLKNPVLICSTAHIICRECVSSPMTCPWPGCNENISEQEYEPDPNVTRYINSLIIMCVDCDWHGLVADEEEHIDTCQYRQVQCTNKLCSAMVLRKDQKAHISKCSEPRHPCPNAPNCLFVGQKSQLEEHMLFCNCIPCRWTISGCKFRGTAELVTMHEAQTEELHKQLGLLMTKKEIVVADEDTQNHTFPKIKSDQCAQTKVTSNDANTKHGRLIKNKINPAGENPWSLKRTTVLQMAGEMKHKGQNLDVKQGKTRNDGEEDPLAKDDPLPLNTRPSSNDQNAGIKERPRTVSSEDSSKSMNELRYLDINGNLALTRTLYPETRPSCKHMRKRKPGKDSDAGGPAKVRKTVRIRLPSPFLQPDTDSEEGDVEIAAENEAETVDNNESDEELDDLVVSTVPTVLTGAGDDLDLDRTPTPASVLAQWQVSKPIYEQFHGRLQRTTKTKTYRSTNELHVPQLTQSISPRMLNK